MALIWFAALALSGQAVPSGELEYRSGDLAYHSLVTGDLARAERQLASSRSKYTSDPAWLLNYGYLLGRSGRVNEAAEILRIVRSAPDTEVVLASGEVIGTREASRRSLTRLRLSGFSSR